MIYHDIDFYKDCLSNFEKTHKNIKCLRFSQDIDLCYFRLLIEFIDASPIWGIIDTMYPSEEQVIKILNKMYEELGSNTVYVLLHSDNNNMGLIKEENEKELSTNYELIITLKEKNE